MISSLPCWSGMSLPWKKWHRMVGFLCSDKPLVGGWATPLKNDGLRQLGWWMQPNMNGKMPNWWQPFTTNQKSTTKNSLSLSMKLFGEERDSYTSWTPQKITLISPRSECPHEMFIFFRWCRKLNECVVIVVVDFGGFINHVLTREQSHPLILLTLIVRSQICFLPCSKPGMRFLVNT